jgi:hypothetical protein
VCARARVRQPQVQALPLHFNDPTLLLPVVVEHTIDERSPLYGALGGPWAALRCAESWRLSAWPAQSVSAATAP